MNNEDDEVARFMKGVARAMERKPVPDSQAMWSRIQLAERQRLAERARRPIRFAWTFAKCWFVGGAGLIFYESGISSAICFSPCPRTSTWRSPRERRFLSWAGGRRQASGHDHGE